MDYGDFLRSRLGGGNEIEWKEMKRIILEYSSLSSFGSFSGGNEKLIPLFKSLSGREWNEWGGEYSLFSISSKP